jgi:hypothetical protein
MKLDHPVFIKLPQKFSLIVYLIEKISYIGIMYRHRGLLRQYLL